MKILVVVNPRAGSGKAAAVGDALCRALEQAGLGFEREDSHGPGHASELARSAAGRGAGVVAAVGGDGTFNEVAQALLGERGQPVPGPELCLVPAGTGSDLGRTLALATDVDQVLSRLRAPPRAVDLGHVEFALREAPERRGTRAFLNVASVGFSAVVAARCNRAPKWLGGRLIYLGASLVSALGYRNVPLVIRNEGLETYTGKVTFVAFCNGRYFGGAMKIAPDADPTDGKLDSVLIGDLSKRETYALTSHIYEGTHVSRPRVAVSRGHEFEVTSTLPESNIEIEIDGETPGFLPAKIRLFPGAVHLRC
jgi:YegS/Rv2252/BmrU family lipid kinase